MNLLKIQAYQIDYPHQKIKIKSLPMIEIAPTDHKPKVT